MPRQPRHFSRAQAGALRQPRLRRAFSSLRLLPPDETRPFARLALSTTLWAVVAGVALFAVWELGNFRVLLGNAPLLPAATQEGPYRPAGGTEEAAGGCTQAPIDRATGQTMPADCHT